MKVFKINIQFILIFFCIQSSLFAQQANIWYFGDYAGLDFNVPSGTPPIPLNDGQTFVNEGAASVADEKGQLLFYTDGGKIWDRSHTVMPNGSSLKPGAGGGSSSQGALIAPVIGNPNKYYLFTVGGFSAAYKPLAYTLIDRCLIGNGTLGNSLGDIDTAWIKTMTGKVDSMIILTDSLDEKLTAVRHTNGTDYWVISHKDSKDSFYAYLVSTVGVDPNPIKSAAGLAHVSTFTKGGTGYLKPSHNGEKLVMAHGGIVPPLNTSGLLQIFDFNASNGQISNGIKMSNDTTYSYYGVDFSPNDSFVFVSNVNVINGATVDTRLSRFDTYASNIPLTETDLGAVENASVAMGPDGVIYIAKIISDKIHAVLDPNNRLAPNFVLDYITLPAPATTGLVSLPNMFNYYVTDTLPIIYAGIDTSICLDNNIQLGRKPTDGYTYNWSPTAGLSDSTISNPIAAPIIPTQYILSVSLPCTTYYDTSFITINPLPNISLGSDSIICEGDSVMLDAGAGYTDYVWSTGETTQIINIQNENNYTVNVFDNVGCTDSDTMSLNVSLLPALVIGQNDTSICNGTELGLSASGADHYIWFPSEGLSDSSISNPFFIGEKSALYQLIGSNDCGIDTISINISVISCELFVPNAFSPNGDGENDLFSIRGSGINNLGINIYDRWGNKVFVSNSQSIYWDGTYNGVASAEGVYVYRLTAKMTDHAIIEETGNITLVR